MQFMLRNPDTGETRAVHVYLLMKKPSSPCSVCQEYTPLLYGVFPTQGAEEPLIVRCNKHLFGSVEKREA